MSSEAYHQLCSLVQYFLQYTPNVITENIIGQIILLLSGSLASPFHGQQVCSRERNLK
jgi:hypothetical protein